MKKNIYKFTALSMALTNAPILSFAIENVDVVDNIDYSNGMDYTEIISKDDILAKIKRNSLEKSQNISMDNSKVSTHTLYSGGDGSKENPYLISTADDLVYLSESFSSNQAEPLEMDSTQYYKLTNNISLNNNTSFAPIGDPHNPFTGVFDGCNYTISDLTWVYSQTENWQSVGLFGAIRNSEIKNLKLDNFNIKAHENLGAVSGYTFDINTIENIEAKNITLNGLENIGGLVGSNEMAFEEYLGASLDEMRENDGYTPPPPPDNKFGDFKKDMSDGNFEGQGKPGKEEMEHLSKNQRATAEIPDNRDILAPFEDSFGKFHYHSDGPLDVILYVNNSTFKGDIILEDTTGDSWSSIYNVGGIIGYSEGEVLIDKANVLVNISSDIKNNDIGGMVGRNYKTTIISDSSIVANINNAMRTVGGFVGYGEFTEVHNCTSDVRITGYKDDSRDITYNNEIGGAVGKGDSVIINNLNSKININCEDGERIGGIIGESLNLLHLKNIDISGEINSIRNCIGGLVGSYSYYVDEEAITDTFLDEMVYLGLISNVTSNISILGEGYIGGFFGEIHNYKPDSWSEEVNNNFNIEELTKFNSINIEDSIINGKIIGECYTGGMIGYLDSNIFTDNVEINANMRGTDFTGGAIGYIEINESYINLNGIYIENNNDVVGSYATGGIIGYINRYDDRGFVSIHKTSFIGNINGAESTGGIIGEVNDDSIYIQNVFSNGTISGKTNVARFIGTIYTDYLCEVQISDAYSAMTLLNGSIHDRFDFINIEEPRTPTNLDSKEKIVCAVPINNLYFDKDLNVEKLNPKDDELFKDAYSDEIVNDIIIEYNTVSMQNKRPLTTMSLDYDNIWHINKDYYPTFRLTNPIEEDYKEDSIVKGSKYDIISIIENKDENINGGTIAIIEDNIDIDVVGSYIVKYKVSYDDGYSEDREITIHVTDINEADKPVLDGTNKDNMEVTPDDEEIKGAYDEEGNSSSNNRPQTGDSLISLIGVILPLFGLIYLNKRKYEE